MNNGQRNEPRRWCPNFTQVIISTNNEETVPLLNGNENDNCLVPLDFILAAILTIILTLSILSGIYLIIEGKIKYASVAINFALHC